MNSARRTVVVVRRGGAAGAVLATALGLAACSGPAATGPEATTAAELTDVREEVASLRDEVATLEDRVADLQDRLSEEVADEGAGEPGDEPGAPDQESPDGDSPEAGRSFFGDTGAPVGEQVTVAGEVVELVVSTDVASVLRIAGETGAPLAVVTVTPAPEVALGDEVEVSGTVVDVDADTFEADFGIAADELFDDPQAWLAGAENEIAIAASSVSTVLARPGS